MLSSVFFSFSAYIIYTLVKSISKSLIFWKYYKGDSFINFLLILVCVYKSVLLHNDSCNILKLNLYNFINIKNYYLQFKQINTGLRRNKFEEK